MEIGKLMLRNHCVVVPAAIKEKNDWKVMKNRKNNCQ